MISYFSTCESVQAIESDIPTTVSHGSIFLEAYYPISRHLFTL